MSCKHDKRAEINIKFKIEKNLVIYMKVIRLTRDAG